MKLLKSLLASAALAVSFGASAQVTAQLGGGTGSFLMLSGPAACTAMAPCTLGGVATIVGGSTYDQDYGFADAEAFGGVFGRNFLAAGPTPGQPSVMNFGAGVDYVSFLWGSPDTYNTLTVNYVGGSDTYSAGYFGFPGDGNQSFARYVEFIGSTTSLITSLVFSNMPAVDAFEVANLSITPVPEPETYALMLAGLGALGFIARRRKRG